MGLFLNEQLTNGQDAVFKIVYFIIESLIIIAAFLFKAFAINYIAKKRGLDKTYLAFIPFFNFILLGKIVGKTVVWGKKVDNVGLILCIMTLANFVVSTLLNLGYYAQELGSVFGFTITGYKLAFVENWMKQTGAFFYVIDIIYTISAFIELFFRVSVYFLIFRMYCPERAFMYMIISVLVDSLFGVFLFIVRKRNPFDFNSFYGARYTTYNPYGNPYNNPYNNDYNSKAYSQPEGKKEEDPFPEFSDKEVEEVNIDFDEYLK